MADRISPDLDRERVLGPGEATERLSLATPKDDPTSMRGALKLEVSTSTPVVVAGTEFSIFVVIRNPFSVPVVIRGTETHIPVALSDENWRKMQLDTSSQDLLDELSSFSDKKPIIRWLFGIRTRSQHLWRRLARFVRPDPGPRIAIAVTPDTKYQFGLPPLSFRVDTGGGGVVGGSVDTSGGDFIGRDYIIHVNINDLTEEELNNLLWKVYELSSQRPYRLQPGDSTVVHFVLKTTRWLTFSPIAHTFQIQVRYEAEGVSHVDTIPFDLNIRAPMLSAMVGAILGSILGAIVRQQPVQIGVWDAARLVITSMVFAVVIVVAFARQNTVQQVISVEDFWGGIFVGFLVGYVGESFVDTIIATPGS